MRMRDILKRATLVAAMTGAVPAGATELKMVIGNGPQHDGTKVMEQWAGDLETRTDGALTARVFPATLVTVKEIPAGLKSGLADIGQIVYPYHPAEFPEAAFISDFSLFATSNVAAAGAMAEYMLTCTDCREELHRNGLVYFGGLANAPYSLLATKRIVSLDDFDGLRVRSGGDAWGRWIEGLGGIKVSIPSQDAYQALSQGMLDAHTHSIGSLIDQSLVDVVTDVTDIPAGVYFGAAWNFSKKSWDALSDDERAILFERAPYGLALSNTTLELSRRKVMDQLSRVTGSACPKRLNSRNTTPITAMTAPELASAACTPTKPASAAQAATPIWATPRFISMIDITRPRMWSGARNWICVLFAALQAMFIAPTQNSSGRAGAKAGVSAKAARLRPSSMRKMTMTRVEAAHRGIDASRKAPVIEPTEATAVSTPSPSAPMS